MPVIAERVTVTLKKIVLATDFSAVSEKAAGYARALALRFQSTVEVAHIFNPSVASRYEESILEMPDDEMRRIDCERLGTARANLLNAGVTAHAILAEGHTAGADLLRIAKQHQADLIVAGTRSKSGLDRLVLGSTAEDLIRHAECPVLTVGPNAKPAGEGPLAFQTIVYATDFSAEAAKAAAYALSFAQDSGAHLVFCYVRSGRPNSDPGTDPGQSGVRESLDRGFEAALKQLIPESSYDWCSPEVVVEHGDAGQAILSLAARVKADLIVLGARKASFWLTHIERGLTPQLLSSAKCPVMTVC
jgi:nucleotide-binding universal stress UspA family protein